MDIVWFHFSVAVQVGAEIAMSFYQSTGMVL